MKQHNFRLYKATYKGHDSLGYESGMEYQLKVYDKKGIYISRLNGSGVCAYESLYSFLKYWTLKHD